MGNIVKDPEGWNDQKLGLEETSYTKAEKVLLLKFLSCQQLISTGALVLIPKSQFLPAQENDENKRKKGQTS